MYNLRIAQTNVENILQNTLQTVSVKQSDEMKFLGGNFILFGKKIQFNFEKKNTCFMQVMNLIDSTVVV